MASAITILDTGLKRYMQIKVGEHKDYTLDVLELSIADQFDNCYKNGMDITAELFSGAKQTEKYTLLSEWLVKLNYTPNRIGSQKKIANTLYKNNKYYLD